MKTISTTLTLDVFTRTRISTHCAPIHCDGINKLQTISFWDAVISWNVMRFSLDIYPIKVKVKQSHYRPGQTMRVPGGCGSQISRQSAHESVKVVSPTHRPPLSTRKYSWYSFLLEAESTPGP
jgi:hypothetical protein